MCWSKVQFNYMMLVDSSYQWLQVHCLWQGRQTYATGCMIKFNIKGVLRSLIKRSRSNEEPRRIDIHLSKIEFKYRIILFIHWKGSWSNELWYYSDTDLSKIGFKYIITYFHFGWIMMKSKVTLKLYSF
jgi:hypothetical protein